MKEIKLNKGFYTLVDDEDFEFLNQWKWYEHHGYAVRTKRVGLRRFNKTSQIYMHRLLNQTSDGLDTDHVNRNKLDNRKANLRTSTRTQNQINKGRQKNNTSGYAGISWSKEHQKWVSRISNQRRQIYLGSYSSIQSAWLARRWGERLYFGELNELKEDK